MKRITTTACLLFFLGCLHAQMPDSAAMMKNWMEYMTPGKPHKLMASWDGTWTGDVTMWMMPGAAPTQSKVTTVNTTVLGGRYQHARHMGNFGGMPFEGISTLAYDNAKKVFITTWIDNMGTGVMVLEGPWNEATRSMTVKGKMVDPSSGKEMDVRETFRVVDQDHQVMEMFAQGPDGKEFKTMEIRYARSK